MKSSTDTQPSWLDWFMLFFLSWLTEEPMGEEPLFNEDDEWIVYDNY